MPSKPGLLANPLVSKIAIGVAAAILFFLVLQVSLVGVLRDTDPELALRIAPYDAQAMSTVAGELILKSQTPQAREQAQTLAIAAVRRDPTSVEAMRTLGFIRELEGNPEAAFRLMKQSEAFSRRDLLTQMWLIEHFSAAGDIGETLRHYDVSMRASDQGKELLVPILVGAAADPGLQGPIRSLLARKPQWWMEFVNALITNGDVGSAVNLTRGLLDPRVPEERALAQNLITRLTNEKNYPLAWDAFSAARSTADRKWSPGTVRNGDFESSDALPLFDWVFADDSELSAVRIGRPDGSNGSALGLTAQGDRQGNVAFQMLHLAPGAYRLTFVAGAPDGVTPPSVTISCPATGVAPVSARPAAARGAAAGVGREFSIAANCPWQWLTVRANAATDQVDAPVWVDDIAIQPVGK